MSDRPLSTRALRIALATALAWGVLVAAHEGEFYPFSIFPMFSQAGKPWTRVLVQEAEAPPYDWSYRGLDSLNGLIPLLPLGVPQNDVSTFVGKTTEWDGASGHTLGRFMAPATRRYEAVLVYRVTGRLAGDVASIQAHPLAFATADTLIFSPNEAVR